MHLSYGNKVVSYCIVLYCISGSGGGQEETRGRMSQGSGGTPGAGVKGAGETGELFLSSDAGLTYGVLARFWRHRTVLTHFL